MSDAARTPLATSLRVVPDADGTWRYFLGAAVALAALVAIIGLSTV